VDPKEVSRRPHGGLKKGSGRASGRLFKEGYGPGPSTRYNVGYSHV